MLNKVTAGLANTLQYFVYATFVVFETFLRPLPAALCGRIGSALGFLSYYVLGSYRRLAIHNLTIAFGNEKNDTEIRRLARRHFCRLGLNLISSIKTTLMSEHAVEASVIWEGQEQLRKYESENRGVVFFLSHLSNWELLANLTTITEHKPTGAVFQSIANRWLNAHVRKRRARFGLRLFDRSEGFHEAMQMLREGGMIGVLADQHAGDSGIWCPFFGRLASTTSLPALMARRTGAALVPLTVRNEKPGKWRLIVSEPLDAHLEKPTIRNISAAGNLFLERQIRLAPEDWFWVHDRWKTPPVFLLTRFKRGIAFPPGFNMDDLTPFRMLVRSPNWLGDACMSAPAVVALKRGRPDASITILCEEKLRDIWESVPEVDHVLTKTKKDNPLKVGRKIRTHAKFDVGVLFPNSLRSALEFRFAKIPHVVGYAGHKRSRLLHQIIEPPEGRRPPEHQLRNYLRIVARVGGDIEANDLLPMPNTLAASPSGKVRIGLCPGAEYGGAKRWPAENYAAVATEIVRRLPSAEWVLFGIDCEQEFGEVIERSLNGNCVNLIGRTTLRQVVDELKTCHMLLTNDTGSMHLAAHLGVPTVAIFGPTEPAITRAIGSGHSVIRHHVECSPCFLRECPLDWRCMTSVDVQEVAFAVVHKIRAAGVAI